MTSKLFSREEVALQMMAAMVSNTEAGIGLQGAYQYGYISEMSQLAFTMADRFIEERDKA